MADWLATQAELRLRQITGPYYQGSGRHFHSPRTARRLTAEKNAAEKVARVNEGERPEQLDVADLRQRLAERNE